MPPVIRPRAPQTVDADLLAQLARIPPAAIGHLQDFGFMDSELRPAGRRGFTVCGPAVTVKTTALDNAVVHHAIDVAEPGDVLVIDRNGDRKHAAWGEMTSLAAKVRGLAMTIVDGPLTDLPEIEAMEYLVFARGVSPITTRSTGQSGEINTVVQCGGVSVAPGDIVLADDNGILIVPAAQLAEVVDRCAFRVEAEARTRKRLQAGEKLGEISGATERLMRAIEEA